MKKKESDDEVNENSFYGGLNSEFFAQAENEEDYYGQNSEHSELILKNVNKKNEGWYRCEANNLLGKISANFYLHIKSKQK
jgi:hypothetical protein